MACVLKGWGQIPHLPSTKNKKIIIDSLEIQHAIAYLNNHSFKDQSTQMIILVNGEVIFAGDSINKVHNIYSCTKTITSTVLGLAIEDKKVKLNDFAWQYEPILKQLYPKAKIKHFASMTSGYSAQGRSRWNDENSDWSLTPYLPDVPHFEPGTKYEYWDEAQMMYGKVLTTALKMSLYDYFDQKVGQKIGLGTWQWGTEGTNDFAIQNNGCTGVFWNAVQMAKVGQLFLNNGKWNGEQIVPKSWIKKGRPCK